MTGKSQHYLPASYLARFSADSTSIRGRKRVLNVLRRDRPQDPFLQTANNLGCRDDLYTLTQLSDPNADPYVIDKTWQGYESRLGQALDALVEGESLSAQVWLRVLVPFVAGVFLRGPDFNKRFARRTSFLKEELSTWFESGDNVNRARLLELQRLMPAMMVAKWTVIHLEFGAPVITNDLGYFYFTSSDTKIGYAIPLQSDALLLLSPSSGRDILELKGSSWKPIIEHSTRTVDRSPTVNEVVAAYSQEFIAGPSRQLIERYASNLVEPRYEIPDPVEIGFPGGRLLRAHEFEWHRLVGPI